MQQDEAEEAQGPKSGPKEESAMSRFIGMVCTMLVVALALVVALLCLITEKRPLEVLRACVESAVPSDTVREAQEAPVAAVGAQEDVTWLPKPLVAIQAAPGVLQEIRVGLKDDGSMVWGRGKLRPVQQPPGPVVLPPEERAKTNAPPVTIRDQSKTESVLPAIEGLE